MATRMQARIAVVQILYAKDLGNEKAIESAPLFLDEAKIRNKQQEFALSLLHGVCDNESDILHIIKHFTREWDIKRLGVIEKNILKLGTFELTKTKTEAAVIINEAIELSKLFNINDASKLINGVLDSISKTSKADIEKIIFKGDVESAILTEIAGNIESSNNQETKPSEGKRDSANKVSKHGKDSKNKKDSKDKVAKGSRNNKDSKKGRDFKTDSKRKDSKASKEIKPIKPNRTISIDKPFDKK